MSKKMVCCIAVLFLVVGIIAYLDEYVIKSEVEEQETPITVYNNVYGYKEKIEYKFSRWCFDEEYKLQFQESGTPEKADIVFSSDLSDMNESKQYQAIAYSPLVVVMQKTEYMEEYEKAGLLTKEGKQQIYKNNQTSINFIKLIDAVIEEKNWSYFGGEEEKIKVFCPRLDTVEGELFYQFLLITINGGTYPETEEKIVNCQKKAELFLHASGVSQVAAGEKISENKDIRNDVYIMFESDQHEARTDNQFAVIYPSKTIIKNIYYQVNTSIGDKFDEKLYEQKWFVSSLYYDLTNASYYRTKNNDEFYHHRPISYVEIPKSAYTSYIRII